MATMLLSHRVVYEWTEMFKSICMSMIDTECLGNPITATSAYNEERVRELNLQNRSMIVNKLGRQMNISLGPAYSMVHVNLQFQKVFAWWVPKELTEEQEHMLLDICSCHLAHYH
jgi:hypothetical protein